MTQDLLDIYTDCYLYPLSKESSKTKTVPQGLYTLSPMILKVVLTESTISTKKGDE